MIDVLVVGGGPAGGSLAAHLARAGREVVLAERDAVASDKVCGEFLSHEAGTYLQALGVDPLALGAVPIDRVRLCASGGGQVAVESPLPFQATSLSRRVLDEAVLNAAIAAGAQVRRGVAVKELSRTADGSRARLADGTELRARTAFLATGKHDLRGHKRPDGLQNDLVAFKMHFRLAPHAAARLRYAVELHLFEGGYAGLEPIEDGLANLCLVVRRRYLRRWDELVSLFETRLGGATACWKRPLALSFIPYGLVRWRSATWCLGDQAAVIPSFAGEGISMALHGARLAADVFLRGGTAGAFQRRLGRDVAGQVLAASALSHLLVRATPQRGLAVAAHLWPRLLSAVAAGTRLPEAALSRATARA